MPTFARLLAVLVPLAGCWSEPPTMPPVTVEVALDAGVKLGGCAVGDVLADRPGDEVVAVAEDGRVFLVYDDGGEWASRELGRAGGELIQCAIGDVRPDRPGNEIVAVGMKVGGEDDGGVGAAVVFWREGADFAHEVVCEDAALLHGVCVADLDPARPGDEALLVGFSRTALLLSFVDAAFTTRAVADLPGAGKNAVGFEGGAAVACNDGSVLLVKAAAGGAFGATPIDKAPGGAARLGTADGSLVVAYDDGTLGLLADGTRTVIYQGTDKLRGAVLAELDPTTSGPEAATGGYQKQVLVLSRRGDDWQPTVVYEDAERIHHVAAGDVTPRGPGDELVACGFSGKLVVIRRGD